MRLTEDQLKQIFQQRSAGTTRRRTGCLTQAQFTRAAAGEMRSEERREVARHLINCISCTEDYRTLRSLQPWADDAQAMLSQSPDSTPLTLIRDANSNAPGSRRKGASSPADGSGLRRLRGSLYNFWQGLIWERRSRAVAAVAAIVVVVGSSLIVWRAVNPQEATTSSERAAVSLRLSVEPPNKATITEPPSQLSWSALERTLAYRVVLYDFQSTPIWESARLKESSATLPDSVRQRLLRDQTYYWRVIAEDAIDQRQSDLFQFTIAGDERK